MRIIKVLIVANKKSGNFSKKSGLTKLINNLEKNNIDYELFYSNSIGEIALYCKKFGNNFNTIIVIGGDGTINEAIQGLTCSDFKLGIIPAGTSNVLAKTLNITGNPDVLIKNLIEQNYVEMDIFSANNRLFSAMVSAGIDSFAVETLPLFLKKVFSELSYILVFFNILLTYRIPELEIIAGNKKYRGYEVIASNIQKYGGNFILNPSIDLNDNLIDLFIFKHFNLVNSLKTLYYTIVKKDISLLDFVTHLKVSEFIIKSVRKVPVQFDGDKGLYTDLKVRLFPKKLKIIV